MLPRLFLIVLLTQTTFAGQEANRKTVLIKRVLTLTRSTLVPKLAADSLGCALGFPRRLTEVRTEYELARCDLIDEGTVATAKGWIAVSFKPTASLQLTLQDWQPFLRDVPSQTSLLTGMSRDGPRVVALQYLYAVPAGMLVIEVPADDTPGVPHDRVQHIVITNELSPALRAVREGAEKQN